MNNYRFAQLFVRISRIIGLLVFISGLGFASLSFLSTRSEHASARYESSFELKQLLVKLKNSERQTVSILRSKRLLGSREFYRSELPDEAPLKPADFETLASSLSDHRSATSDLKAYLLEDFEGSVQIIRNKLLEFAKSLGKSESKDREPRRKSSPAAPSVKFGIFEPEARSTFSERVDSISEVIDFLSRLEAESTQEDSKKVLAKAMQEATDLLSIIPKISNSSVPVFEEPSEEEETFRAEIVADALAEAIETVRLMITEEWSVQSDLEAAQNLLAKEKKKMESSAGKRRLILLIGVGRILALLVGSALASFLILVIADFLQTQLDIAENSFIISGRQ